MAKQGRPVKKDPKTKGYRIRMSQEEMDELDRLQECCQKSKAEIIRTALHDYGLKTKKKMHQSSGSTDTAEIQ